jgi:multidrug resistance protein MdtO
MASIAQTVPESRLPLAWFGEFLKEELAPYPGRFDTVARMVIAATLVMIAIVTFRIPYGFQGAVLALLISREDPQATLRSAGSMALITGVGAAWVLASMLLLADMPEPHFLWNISAFFIVFYGLSTIANYGAVIIFAIMIAIAVPLWDRHLPAETNVEDTLWVVGGTLTGCVMTALVELVFAQFRPRDQLVGSIADRLASVEEILPFYLEGRPVDAAAESKITRFAMVGTSRLRRILRRSTYPRNYRERMGTVIGLTGRLVDIAANVTHLGIHASADDRKRISDLAANIASIRSDLLSQRVPRPIAASDPGAASEGVPLLREMERAVAQIPAVFSGSVSFGEEAPAQGGESRRSTIFAQDALSNPDHLKFAVRGGLAASLCYIIYNAIAWPAISTSVTTCLLTGLSTIGASRQKQVLRFAGAIAGGFVLGMGSQIFILPRVDSITGFTILFVAVTAVASWFMTSSPRLSYFGVQIMVAFYLINLQEFAMQTSLAVARDRVVGVLLGLIMMWLVFDQLWSVSAGAEMKKTFVATLRLLAQLATDPLPGGGRPAIERSYALRETINANFDTTRALADGVLFEFGPSRQEDMALRSRIRRWQPQLRLFFVTRIALLKYRLELPGFELPAEVEAAQGEFDDGMAGVLEGIADRIDGVVPGARAGLEDSLEHLEQTVRSCCSVGPENSLTPEVQTFLDLSRNIANLTMWLDREIAG